MKNRSREEQLFALMLYKNVDANDFKAVHERRGLLYTLFNKKQDLVSDLIELKKIDESNRNSTTMRDLLINFEDDVRFMCEDDESTESEEKENARNLLFYLIRNGYIDEKYLSLISHEYRGQLSASDFLFYRSVKNFQALPPDYHIDNVSMVYSMLKENDLWKSPGILNYKLLDHTLRKKDSTKLSIFVQTMLRFEIAGKSDFFKNAKEEKNKNALFPYLFHCNLNFDWNLLIGPGNVKVFWQLVSAMHAFKRDDLKDCMKKYFKNNERSFKNSERLKSCVQKMKKNQLIFRNLSSIWNKDEIEYIKKNDLYELNLGNLKLLTRQPKGDDKGLLKKCFLDKNIRKYIDENIETFINKTFRSSSFNHNTQEELVYRVLLSPNIDEDFAKKSVNQHSAKIKDIEKFINDYGLQKDDLNKSVVMHLFEQNRVENNERNMHFKEEFFRSSQNLQQ
jgi:hypothetical protein